MVEQRQQQARVYTNPEIEAILAMVDEKPWIAFIFQRFSNINGGMLGIVESALPEGKQCSAVKKKVSNIVYGIRDDLFRYFKGHNFKVSGAYVDDSNVTVEGNENLEFIAERFDALWDRSNMLLKMSLPDREQRFAVGFSMNESLQEHKKECLKYFYRLEKNTESV